MGSRRKLEDNVEYYVCGPDGKIYEWFLRGIEDWLDGKGDLPQTVGKHMRRAPKSQLVKAKPEDCWKPTA